MHDGLAGVRIQLRCHGSDIQPNLGKIRTNPSAEHVINPRQAPQLKNSNMHIRLAQPVPVSHRRSWHAFARAHHEAAQHISARFRGEDSAGCKLRRLVRPILATRPRQNHPKIIDKFRTGQRKIREAGIGRIRLIHQNPVAVIPPMLITIIVTGMCVSALPPRTKYSQFCGPQQETAHLCDNVGIQVSTGQSCHKRLFPADIVQPAKCHRGGRRRIRIEAAEHLPKLGGLMVWIDASRAPTGAASHRKQQ